MNESFENQICVPGTNVPRFHTDICCRGRLYARYALWATNVSGAGFCPGFVKYCQTVLTSSCFLRLSAGSQDSLLEITFRSSVPPVICDPTTPKPEMSALNLPLLGTTDMALNAFASSNGNVGSPLGRDHRVLKLECFRFLPGPPGPAPPPLCLPPPPLETDEPEAKEMPEDTAKLSARSADSLSCLDFAAFRESGIDSECESNTDDSDEREEEGEEEEEEEGEELMEFFGWGTEAETLRLLNVLNKQVTPDCLGYEIAV